MLVTGEGLLSMFIFVDINLHIILLQVTVISVCGGKNEGADK